MNFKLNLLAFISLILISLWASGQNYLSTKIEKECAFEDFEYFKKALVEGHPSLYWHTDSIELQNAFSILQERLRQKKSVSNIDFHGLLTEIMQMVGCGHSAILFPKHYGNYIDSVDLYLPLKVT